MNRPPLGIVVAVIVACVSAAIAVMLIIGSATLGARTAAEPTEAPIPTETAAPIPASSSAASTMTPYEQLRGQMLAILEVDGAQKAYDLLAAAIDASPDAAPLCRQVVKDLASAYPALDWASACSTEDSQSSRDK